VIAALGLDVVRGVLAFPGLQDEEERLRLIAGGTTSSLYAALPDTLDRLTSKAVDGRFRHPKPYPVAG
jgi:hypothetical protein